MIHPWTEIDIEFFKEIFEHYKNHQGESEDKVIEIQNLSGIHYNEVPTVRVFIGAKINPLDYRDWNSGICSVFDNFSGIIGDDYTKEEFSTLNMCFFSTGPLITPFGHGNKNSDTFMITAFGNMDELKKTVIPAPSDRLVMWYRKEPDGTIVYDMTRQPTDLPDTKRFIRIRMMDFSDWKKIIDGAIKHAKFPDDFTKDDLKKEDFVAIEYKET